jgi:hypothetical protein
MSRVARRLHAELADDGVSVAAEEATLGVILDELEYARRPPVFERRTPVYGSFVVPDDRSLVGVGELVDLVDLDHLQLESARRFSDGRSSYLVRHLDGHLQLACFQRSVQYEADMVEIQDYTGAFVVQRTVMGVTRLFAEGGTVEWAGYRWSIRPNARAQYAILRPQLPDVSKTVLGGLLKLAVHWLSPARVGATLMLHPGADDDDGLDLEHSIVAPALSVTSRHHYAAMLAALMQSDLAVLVDAGGTVRRMGVGLRNSSAADTLVDDARGMRHRSAARYTYDHPDAVAVVVSEDGPVTVFYRGRSLSECPASAA